ncbi:MAG: hypothetical protein DSY37_02960 [Hyperthermus sp.]|nr:MAG: hypothetical protein DSY37_02960 [Hyperthermus sp.]
MFDELKRLLRDGFCDKVVVVEESGSCSLVYCGGRLPLLLALAKWNEWFYVKAVAEKIVAAHMWHCSDIFYNPYGVYVFRTGEDEVVDALREKEKYIVAQARLAELRALGA